MKGRLMDLAVGMDGKQRLTLLLESDFREAYAQLRESDVNIEIKKYHKRRSLDSNAYAWVLIDKLAEALRLTKEEVYRECIREIGGVSETVCVRNEAVERLCNGWKHNGLGWFTDKTPSKLTGCTNVTLYYGSSVYDSKQMGDLIDAVIEACKEQGIETATPAELAMMQQEWSGR